MDGMCPHTAQLPHNPLCCEVLLVLCLTITACI